MLFFQLFIFFFYLLFKLFALFFKQIVCFLLIYALFFFLCQLPSIFSDFLILISFWTHMMIFSFWWCMPVIKSTTQLKSINNFSLNSIIKSLNNIVLTRCHKFWTLNQNVITISAFPLNFWTQISEIISIQSFILQNFKSLNKRLLIIIWLC